MQIYCITHKILNFIEKLNFIPCGVGKLNFPKNYIDEKNGENISFKNHNYGELTFHYWFWKNRLNSLKKNEWFGICHYRRFFINEKISFEIDNWKDLNNILLKQPKKEWDVLDVILCDPISVENQKIMKLLKRGLKSIIRNPAILYNKKKRSIKLHFDMFHGYSNLEKAINLLPERDREDFSRYVNEKTSFSPNCMYLSNNKEIVFNFYSNLFSWLQKCEDIFGFSNTRNYDTQRIYTFLTERYLPFWFEKYANVGYSPWLFKDNIKEV